MNATITTAVLPVVEPERSHRRPLLVGYVLAIALVLVLVVYGFDYYTLDAAHRPFSSKHAVLKPSGTIGLKLGELALLLFCTIFLYPLRKRWRWLSRQGSSKNWLDFHVLAGLAAPLIVAFHSSFKFQGFAGVAFWVMTAVALSGVLGRYVYGQIPHNLNSAELSLAELEQQHTLLAQRLTARGVLPTADLHSLLRCQARPW
jgi:TRAP-type C4-dicarboxylate transport system permease small subunit